MDLPAAPSSPTSSRQTSRRLHRRPLQQKAVTEAPLCCLIQVRSAVPQDRRLAFTSTFWTCVPGAQCSASCALKAVSFFFASPCTLRDLSGAMPSLCFDMTSSQPMESTRHGLVVRRLRRQFGSGTASHQQDREDLPFHLLFTIFHLDLSNYGS
jgi:hypothetical protein